MMQAKMVKTRNIFEMQKAAIIFILILIGFTSCKSRQALRKSVWLQVNSPETLAKYCSDNAVIKTEIKKGKDTIIRRDSIWVSCDTVIITAHSIDTIRTTRTKFVQLPNDTIRMPDTFIQYNIDTFGISKLRASNAVLAQEHDRAKKQRNLAAGIAILFTFLAFILWKRN